MGYINTELDVAFSEQGVADKKIFGRIGLAKRLMDLVISAIALVFLLPLLILVAIAIKTTSSGPIIYKQRRLGLGGKTFAMYKFRSMYLDSEDKFNALLKQCPVSRANWQKYQKLKNDPRITPIGRFLRKSSIDELPQLVNVLTGSMSIVGQRPILPTQKLIYGAANYKNYIRCRPGITGLWQVNGRNELTFEKRTELDSEYYDKWSIGYDISLMVQTVPAVVFPMGAH